MAHLKSALIRKLEKVLRKRFPPPSTIQLEENDGVIGVVTSDGFSGMETIDRQSLIGNLIATHLTPEDRRHVLVIVGVTPDEGTGYLAAEERPTESKRR